MIKRASYNIFRTAMSVSLITFMFGCEFRPTIEITRDYVYNSNWGKENTANTAIWKIILNDKIKNANIDSLSGFELLHNTSLDTTSFYITVPHKEDTKKLYFNKKNKGVKWYVGHNVDNKIEVIGELELDTWYAFAGLYKTWEYYVYVDKRGNIHVWSVNPVNI